LGIGEREAVQAFGWAHGRARIPAAAGSRPTLGPDPIGGPRPDPAQAYIGPVADPISIEDPGDPRLADYGGLKDAALRRRMEEGDCDGHGFFLAEGSLVLRRLLGSPYPLRSVLVTRQRLPALTGDLAGVTAPVYVVGQEVMNEVTGFNIHRGVLAVAGRTPPLPAAELLARGLRIAVLEGLNDHENLGVIFRNAAAFGLDGVLLSPECCDPLYRRSVRVSMGYVLEVPYARLAPWPSALAELRAAGFLLVALTPDSTAEDIGRLSLPERHRVALLLGAEGPGLSAGASGLVDVRARIPMAPGVDSLNVANAAAVAFYAASPALTPPSE
jgi:tRNA G18 (ribose-2'-O)-methylase SpoU